VPSSQKVQPTRGGGGQSFVNFSLDILRRGYHKHKKKEQSLRQRLPWPNLRIIFPGGGCKLGIRIEGGGERENQDRPRRGAESSLLKGGTQGKNGGGRRIGKKGVFIEE